MLGIDDVPAEDGENVDAIAQVEGVDVLLVGPFDLGNSIGHPILDGTMSPELKAALAKVLQAAKTHNKRTGIYAVSGEQSREFADQGFNMISIASDVQGLSTYMTSTLATAKGSYLHSAVNVAKGAVAGAAKITTKSDS